MNNSNRESQDDSLLNGVPYQSERKSTRKSRRWRGMPWARALKAKGESMASAMLARTWRTRIGNMPSTSTATGSARCQATSRTRSGPPGYTMPPVGK